MRNIDKLQSCSTEDFLQFINSIRSFSIYNYVNFATWLLQESQDLVFNGEPAVLALSGKALVPCHIVDQKDGDKMTVVYKDPAGVFEGSSPEAAFKMEVVSKDAVYTVDFIESLNRAKALVENKATNTTAPSHNDGDLSTVLQNNEQ